MLNGKFCISLDYEKNWGIVDRDTSKYKENIHNADRASLLMLKLFAEMNIRVSWAIVGLLLTRNTGEVEDLLEQVDYLIYDDETLSPKRYYLGSNKEASLFCSKNVIQKISNLTSQNIISHTMTHLFFCESGINKKVIKKDELQFNQIVKSELGIEVEGIVFPRNQINENLIKCIDYKFYRGNLDNFIDKSYSKSELNIGIKLLRGIDSLLPIKRSALCLPYWDKFKKLNIPATRFLKPVTNINFINWLRLKRIKKEMLFAAKNNGLFHLWWHPHNFGKQTEQNMKMLKEILSYFDVLRKKYGMQTCHMQDIYDEFK